MKGLDVARAALAASLLAACGTSSGTVLERRPESEPPGSNLRVDVFVVGEVRSCAVGSACEANDPQECFYLADDSGPQVTFSPLELEFVPPDDPRVAEAAQAECFRLVLGDGSAELVAEAVATLRDDVYRLSNGEINLDPRVHELETIQAGFKRWENETGLFLEPSALGASSLSLMSRETDFTYAVSGSADPDTGYVPKVDHCAGTNWEAQGGLGGVTYTWFSEECADAERFVRHLLHQIHFGLRDVNRFEDAYARDYPPCGEGDGDPTAWFPRGDDCGIDPDSPTCGLDDCGDGDGEAFPAHVLQAHWPEGRTFVGNHCDNGEQDWDETAVDQGGVCDLIGR